MAKTFTITSNPLKATIYFLLLAIFLGCATSARILDEVEPQPAVVPIDQAPDVPDVAPVVGPATTTLPSGQFPAVSPVPTVAKDEAEVHDTATSPDDDNDDDDVAPVTGPTTTLPTAPVEPPKHEDESPPEATVVAPVAGPVTTSPTGPGQAAATSATVAHPTPEHPPLSFFMHDILGGSHPSARVVTGIIANSQVNGLPFSKPNNQVFPINGGVPLPNNINGIINNQNNLPFLTGLNSAQTTIIQNNGNNNQISGGNNQPFVTAGSLPAGTTLQELMFGSVTVIDDELTEGHELGSAIIGKAQGFYLASSLDGTSQTIALTILLHADNHDHEEDTISFLGFIGRLRSDHILQ